VAGGQRVDVGGPVLKLREKGKPIRVAVSGALGKMGRAVVLAVAEASDMELVLALDRSHAGEKLTELVGPGVPDLVIDDKLGAALDRVESDVLVDFTHPGAAAGHAMSALKRRVAPVVGTTGLSDAELREIAAACKEFGTPAMVVPNFAVGAVLMMRFSGIAAKWMPHVEIVEMHHDGKAEAPSGTAMLTAEIIAGARGKVDPTKPTAIVKVEGARGGEHLGVRVHSVRLPGLLAHQMVLLGGKGETLTLRHDSLDRSSFMEGVKIAIREVWNLSGLTIGLESILFAHD
jgi:4-hydroxy-tetrahydrodipicolinate reductase